MNIQALTEKYRPQTLKDIRGQDLIIKSLARFVAAPAPKAFLFHGPSGCGKSSAALALARELGCDVEKREWGGLHEIASGECTAESVRELFGTTMRYSTWHGSGWKVCIVNEADNMSDKAGYIWLDVLEKLPARTVVVFTTNDAGKLSSRFKSRCACFRFNASAKGQDLADTGAEDAAQRLIDEIWQAELGHNHAPRLAELENWLDEGNVNFRAVVQSLEERIAAQAEIDKAARQPKKITLAPYDPSAMTPADSPRGALAGMLAAGRAMGLSVFTAAA
jgi:DNA polymerase III delta prime subunit